MPLRTSLGVDISNEDLSVVYLKAAGKKITVAGYGTYPLDKEKKALERLADVRYLLDEFMREKRIVSTDIFVGIPRDWVFMKFIELPLAVKENLRESLGYELEKFVPFPAEEACFDFQVVSEDRDAGQMRVMLAVVKQENIQPLFSLGGVAGTALSGIEFSSSALANFCLRRVDPGWRDALGFFFSAGGQRELGLVEADRLTFSRAFPSGRDGLPPVKAVRQSLEGLRGEAAEDGQHEVPLFIMAGEEEADLLAEGESVEGFEPRVVDPAVVGLPSPGLLTAYGVGLKGFGPVPLEINLLPEAYRKKASRMGAYFFAGACAAVILLALAWGSGYLYQQKRYLDRLQNETTRLEAEVKRIKGIEGERQELLDRMDYLNTLRSGDPQILEILGELTRVIPETAWLRRLTYSEKGVELEGYADSASELIPLLEESPLFKDVTFLSGITKSREGKETFRIGLKIG